MTVSGIAVSSARPTSTIWPGRSAPRAGRRPRLDAVDELLAVLDRVDHRRRELGLVGDVGDGRGQPVRAAVAAHRERGAGGEAGDRRSRRRRPRACRRRRAGSTPPASVGPAISPARRKTSATCAVDRRGERRACRAASAASRTAASAPCEPALGGGDDLGARRQALDGELRLELGDLGPRGVALGDGGVEVRLRHHVAPGQRGLPLGLALGLAQPHLGGLERRLGDARSPPAGCPRAGWRARPRPRLARRLGLGERDLGVGALLAGDDLRRPSTRSPWRTATSTSSAVLTGARWTYSPST